MISDLFELAFVNSKPYLSNISKVEKKILKLKLKDLDIDRQIDILKNYDCDDIQLKTDINILIRNLEKLKK